VGEGVVGHPTQHDCSPRERVCKWEHTASAPQAFQARCTLLLRLRLMRLLLLLLRPRLLYHGSKAPPGL
jgi:hypothetical protein